MFTKVRSATVVGIEGYGVDVEIVFSRRSFPNFKIVGLPHKSVAESKERVLSALRQSGFKIPAARITVNLTPADFPKRGGHFDLPIAVGLLVSAGLISPSAIDDMLCVGELSLDGSVAPIPGVVPIAIYAKQQGVRVLFVPFDSFVSVSTLSGCVIVPVRTLSDMVSHLRNSQTLSDRQLTSWSDMCDVENRVLLPIQGQFQARRALEIALAGGHHMYIKGPPGVGKTLLARCSPHLLPPIKEEEFFEMLAIQSVLRPDVHQKLKRPFIVPPPSISERGLIGGGLRCEIGDLTRAHGGILYLDELPLFKKSVLDSLRRPLDDAYVSCMFRQTHMRLPAQCMIIATGNVCPCGYLGHPTKVCTCTQQAIASYSRKVSGPLRDRFDMHVFMNDVGYGEIDKEAMFSLEDARKRIVQARLTQMDRKQGGGILNSYIPNDLIEQLCPMTKDAKKLLVTAYKRIGFSARAYFSIIRVARTIADIDTRTTIEEDHIAEAIQYRE